MAGESDGREVESKFRGAFPGLMTAADHELRFTIRSAPESTNKRTYSRWPGTVQGRCGAGTAGSLACCSPRAAKSWARLSDRATARMTGWGWMVVGFGFNRPLQASFQQNTAPSV